MNNSSTKNVKKLPKLLITWAICAILKTSAIYSRRVGRQYGICWPKKGTIYGTWYTSFFFRNKTFLFVKIEAEIFSICLILNFMKTRKISAHSDIHSDDILLWGIQVFRMSWKFVRFHEITNQRDAENFRFLSWQTKKFYS